MLSFEDIFDAFKLILSIAVPLFLIVFFLYQCICANHEVTEDSPYPNLELCDFNYKGHTYIYVSGFYSHTIVHASHCKCNNK